MNACRRLEPLALVRVEIAGALLYGILLGAVFVMFGVICARGLIELLSDL